MIVKLADTAGFCFGVERAVDQVNRLLTAGCRPLYTFGPIIHNEQVVEDFAARGVKVLMDLEEARRAEPGTIVLRSHGVSRYEQETLEKLGYQVEDATCPFVKKIHHLVQKAEQEKQQIIICGDPAHPEVKAIMGWCQKTPLVIDSPEAVPNWDPETAVFLVSQTTFHTEKFKIIVEIIQNRYYNATVVNTICHATQNRQQEAEALASRVDAMIVVGGKESSNTRKLAEICGAHCANTYYIQTPSDLNRLGFKPVRVVGITAGASTPKNIIEEVQNFVRSEF